MTKQLSLFDATTAPAIPVLTFESFASAQGASRLGFGDAGLHKSNSSIPHSTHRKFVALQAQKDAALAARRAQLEDVYLEMVAAGSVRPPTRREKMIATANGHPDKESVQAARRVCERQGWAWQA